MRKIKELLSDVPAHYNFFNITFIVVWVFLDSFFVSLLSRLTASVIAGESDFLKAAISFIFFLLGWELLEYIADIFTNKSSTLIENNRFKECFNELYTTSPEVLKKSNTGYIAGLLHKLMHRKQKAYTSFVEWGLMGLLYNIYVAIYIAQFSWVFSLVVAGVSLAGIIIRLVAMKATKKAVDTLNEAEAERTKVFMDSSTNIATVQKLRAQDFINEKADIINNRCIKACDKWVKQDEFFFCLYKFVMYMFCPICLIILYIMGDNIEFDKVEFLSYVAITEVKLVHYSKNISNTIKDYGLWRAIQDKIDSITSQQCEMYTKTSIENNFETVEINNVSYQYTKGDNTITINIPEFKFNKGDFVCISGESGQGKTTTLNLLSGAIENNNIKVDGKPLDKNIGAIYIAQDVEMFDMSLRDNLTLGHKIDDKTLIDLLTEVGLKEWFNCQKEGLDVILGERGVFVSTGQRQRLNLVRGLLIEDKEIYLLDEPTSNVDEETEIKMIELIKEKLKGKTVIIVTHREKIKEICNKHYKLKNSIMYEEK